MCDRRTGASGYILQAPRSDYQSDHFEQQQLGRLLPQRVQYSSGTIPVGGECPRQLVDNRRNGQPTTGYLQSLLLDPHLRLDDERNDVRNGYRGYGLLPGGRSPTGGSYEPQSYTPYPDSESDIGNMAFGLPRCQSGHGEQVLRDEWDNPMHMAQARSELQSQMPGTPTQRQRLLSDSRTPPDRKISQPGATSIRNSQEYDTGSTDALGRPRNRRTDLARHDGCPQQNHPTQSQGQGKNPNHTRDGRGLQSPRPHSRPVSIYMPMYILDGFKIK